MDRKFTDQYISNFEAESYLKGAYTIFSENPDPFAFYRKGKLILQHEIFKQGKVRGKRVLEIGSGPTIDFADIPSLYFDEIYLSDFNKQAREEINKWLNKDSSSHDWTHHFNFIRELEGNRSSLDERQKILRSKVKGVLHCDVLKNKPLHPLTMTGFDCILTSNCINTACTTVEDYEKAVANVAGLLNTGGHYISFIGLGYSTYKVGSFCFQALPMDEETFRKSAEQCGLKVIYCKTIDVNELSAECRKISQLSGYMVLHAVKQ